MPDPNQVKPLPGKKLQPVIVPTQPQAPAPPPNQSPGPRKSVPPVPIGPARPDQDPSPATPIERAPDEEQRLLADVSPPATPTIVTNVALRSADDNNAASSTGEPSVGTVNNIVFYTGNWYASLSTDGGNTFQYVDPFHSFPDPPGMGFCCDQVVQYIPQIDMFVWLLQYTTDENNQNLQRLAFTTSHGIALGQWGTYDIASQDLGFANTMLDFPDLAVGANMLYATTNAFDVNGQWTGSVVVRIPLASIQSSNITGEHFVSSDVFSFRVAQNAGTRAFWAAHKDTSTLRVYTWDEGVPQPTFQDIGVAHWDNANYATQTPDGFNWLGKSDPRVLGATVVGNELWFAWNAGRGGANNRPQPYVQIARLLASDLTVLDNPNIWDPDSAIAYAALGSNVDGVVGTTYMIGGPAQFPSPVVGILNGIESHVTTATGQHGPEEQRWGDYLTIRRHQPEGKLFAATGYTLANGTGRQDGTPHFVLFGPSVAEPRVVLPDSLEAAALKESADARAKMLADPRVQTILATAQAREQPAPPGAEFTPSPGKERWPVKTGTDDGAGNVDLNSPQSTTVEQMALLERPNNMPLSRPTSVFQSLRADPAETTVWTLEAEITDFKIESDGDYHLVIRSDNGYQMIAEIPDPDPAFVDPGSPFAQGIATARATFDAQFPNVTPSFQNASQRARITGVGLFDIKHGQRGFAPTNGIELHPVIGIEFLDGDGGTPVAAAARRAVGGAAGTTAAGNKRIVVTVDLTNIS